MSHSCIIANYRLWLVEFSLAVLIKQFAGVLLIYFGKSKFCLAKLRLPNFCLIKKTRDKLKRSSKLLSHGEQELTLHGDHWRQLPVYKSTSAERT